MPRLPLSLAVAALTLGVAPAAGPASAEHEVSDRGTRADPEGARFLERAAWLRTTLARFPASPAR
ncbi:MAG: hypothetical protein ACREM3_18405 [Candidatus Rokuibacteriota bacterium]